MKGEKLKQFLATIAPTLGSAWGGPLGGIAAKAVASKLLGDDNAPLEDVEAALMGASGADLVKIKEIETAFEAQLKAADVDLKRIAASDRDSARTRQAKMGDHTPTILGLAIVVGFFGVLAYLFRFGLPEQGGEVLMIMVGALAGMVAQVCNFFFGSSSGSKAKTHIISGLKDALK